MVWTFGAGPKVFIYESAVLVVGYSYGYFDLKDLFKVGGILTIVTRSSCGCWCRSTGRSSGSGASRVLVAGFWLGPAHAGPFVYGGGSMRRVGRLKPSRYTSLHTLAAELHRTTAPAGRTTASVPARRRQHPHDGASKPHHTVRTPYDSVSPPHRPAHI